VDTSGYDRHFPENEAVLNDTERLVLLALLRLGEDAYAMPIREEIEDRSGRSLSVTAVYAALERLERHGNVETWLSDPRAERGGRARKHYRIRPSGAEALRRERDAEDRMWEGLETHPALKGP
jgi:DNA-binding PadR family transcriptional regulator